MSSRDPRFVAVHRGGQLAKEHHQLMAVWAADCAEHVLHVFTALSSDDRPARAIAMVRAWVRGEIPVKVAREAAIAAHAAARQTNEVAAVAMARSSGHAAAAAHMADHCLAAAYYALRAIRDATQSQEVERRWQREHLPLAIRPVIASGLAMKYPKLFRSDANGP